eukprot:1092319_1
MADLLDCKTGAGSMFMGLLAVLVVLAVCIAVFKSPRYLTSQVSGKDQDVEVITSVPTNAPEQSNGTTAVGTPTSSASATATSKPEDGVDSSAESYGESGQAVTTLDQGDPNANPTSEFLKAKDDLLATNNDNSSESTMTTVVEVTKSSAQDLTSQMSGKDQDVEVITSVPTNVPEQSNGTTAVGTPTSSASATATSKPEDGVDSSAESYGVSGQVDTTFQRDGTNAIPTSELNKDIEKAGGPTLTVSASRNKLTLTGIPNHTGSVFLVADGYRGKLQLTPDDNGGESVVR